MEAFLYIFAKTIQVILNTVSFAMLVRMILPLFTNPEENKIYLLTCYISEPFIAPVRAVMARLGVGQNSPIDWSFFATYIILWVLDLVLPVI